MIAHVRKLFGAIVLIAFILVYALTAMVIADLKLRDAPALLQLAYFAVAGLIWVIPAGLIIRFMVAPASRR